MKRFIPSWLVWTLLLIAVAAGAWALVMNGWDWRTVLETDPLWAMLLFSLLMFVLPLLGFPISAFYITAGLVFPVSGAIFAGSLGLLGNITLGYLLARFVWREPLENKLSKRWPKFFALDSTTSTQVIILVRAVPGIPFTLQNYLLGVMAVPFGHYLLFSWSIQTIFLCGMVLTVNGAMNDNGMVALWGGLVIVAMLVAVRMVYRRMRSHDVKQPT